MGGGGSGDFVRLWEFDQRNEFLPVARGQLAVAAAFLGESVEGEMAFGQEPDGGVAVWLEAGFGKADQTEAGLPQHSVETFPQSMGIGFPYPRAVIPDACLHARDGLPKKIAWLSDIYVNSAHVIVA